MCVFTHEKKMISKRYSSQRNSDLLKIEIINLCYLFFRCSLAEISPKVREVSKLSKKKAIWWTKILNNYLHSSLLYRKEGFAKFVFTQTMSTNEVLTAPRSNFLTQTLMKNLTQFAELYLGMILLKVWKVPHTPILLSMSCWFAGVNNPSRIGKIYIFQNKCWYMIKYF